MRRLLVLAAALTVGAFGAAALYSHTRARGSSEHGNFEETHLIGKLHCGVERWPVKTLTDPAAGQIIYVAVRTTIPKLTAIPTPSTLPQSARVKPVEITTYRLRGSILVKSKLEGDSDIHLVLKSTLDGQTMIAEIPNPGCVGDPAAAARTKVARDAFVAAFGQPSSSWQAEGKRITVSGVGFFDFLHGQTGVAHNGIELHPLLTFREGT